MGSYSPGRGAQDGPSSRPPAARPAATEAAGSPTCNHLALACSATRLQGAPLAPPTDLQDRFAVHRPYHSGLGVSDPGVSES